MADDNNYKIKVDVQVWTDYDDIYENLHGENNAVLSPYQAEELTDKVYDKLSTEGELVITIDDDGEIKSTELKLKESR